MANDTQVSFITHGLVSLKTLATQEEDIFKSCYRICKICAHRVQQREEFRHFGKNLDSGVQSHLQDFTTDWLCCI